MRFWSRWGKKRGGGRIRTDDNGFAIRRLRPLGYAANGKQIYLERGRVSRGLLIILGFVSKGIGERGFGWFGSSGGAYPAIGVGQSSSGKMS